VRAVVSSDFPDAVLSFISLWGGRRGAYLTSEPNKVFKSLDAVESVLDSLEQSPEKVAGIKGFDWIINLIFKAT
jgi:hypothetical protein